ncbi:MAG: VIT family protein [Micropruina sp.]|uniref:VIT1/CCC1 transporter family protein n=1 Tax=Micropruina sp. TaxID=2737536 RepID=UPI0039E37484
MSTTTAARPDAALASRLNWLRAGVLGANDGIVSTASLVFGVAGATSDSFALLIAGIAGMVAGALSMGGGEYVSVSTQRDTEKAAVERVRQQLSTTPQAKLDELAAHYAAGGLSPELAGRVASELSAHDALGVHARELLGIDADEQTNPWHAAIASTTAFTLGALVPLLAIVASPVPVRLVVTVVAVLVALAGTGYTSARLSGAGTLRPVLRNVIVGGLAMGLTYAAGSLVGGYL